MGTINKWLHGVDGYMDAVPNLLFIFYRINGPKYCLFPIVLHVIMHGNVFLTLSL